MDSDLKIWQGRFDKVVENRKWRKIKLFHMTWLTELASSIWSLGSQKNWMHSTELPRRGTDSGAISVAQQGPLAKVNEPTRTHHYPPKSVVYMRVHFMGFNKHIKTCTHRYSVIQNSFTVLKIPCAPPIT